MSDSEVKESRVRRESDSTSSVDENLAVVAKLAIIIDTLLLSALPRLASVLARLERL
ncbi:MAG: hypothetical protein JOZ36_13250 [Acidobacteria bacterium]|nr:hypothetical protein [Acidobacteriota bacterium]